jgi:heme exporter protein B
MNFIRQAWTIAAKDLLLEFRSRERLMSMLTFSILVAVVFSFTLDPTAGDRPLAAMLWVTIIFAGMLGLGRSFAMEKEQDVLVGILLAPVDRGAVYFGKFLANMVLLAITALVVFLVYAAFFQLSLWHAVGGLAAITLLALAGFMALGTLFSAVTASTRLGDTLLPIVLVPLLMPVVIFAAAATHRLIVGLPFSEVESSVRMLLAFDLIFLLAGTFLFGSVVEE